jgi:hypothetical protein
VRIFLSLSEAVHLAGRAIYGDDWIAGLTPRERDTLIQYPVGGAEPDDPKLRDVIARARHRDGRMTVQRGRALAWLSSSEFDTHPGKRIDRESLERALARDFRAERHGARPVDKVASARSTSAVRPSTPDGERADGGALPDLVDVTISTSCRTVNWPSRIDRLQVDEAAKLLQPAYPTAPTAKENDSELRGELIKVTRELEIRNEIVRAGQNGTIQLVHPTLGISHGMVPEPDWFIDAEGLARFAETVGIAVVGADGAQIAASGDTGKADISSTPTGMPGRPSKGKNLIEDECARRIRDGRALPTLADEARALFDWYKAEYPKEERPTEKTIQNNIRAYHREWMAGQRQTDAT